MDLVVLCKETKGNAWETVAAAGIMGSAIGDIGQEMKTGGLILWMEEEYEP